MGISMVEVEKTDLPRYCIMAHDRLETIEGGLGSANEKLDMLLSHEGPISAMRERIALVEKTAVQAHERIDDVSGSLKVQESQTNSIMIKIAGLASLITSGLVAAIIKFFGGSSG